jgi:hypothetical protein
LNAENVNVADSHNTSQGLKSQGCGINASVASVLADATRHYAAKLIDYLLHA